MRVPHHAFRRYLPRLDLVFSPILERSHWTSIAVFQEEGRLGAVHVLQRYLLKEPALK